MRLAINRSYVVEVSVTDVLGGSKTVTENLPTAAATCNIREGGAGIGIGKYAEADRLLDVAWNAIVQGDMTVDGALHATADMAQFATFSKLYADPTFYTSANYLPYGTRAVWELKPSAVLGLPSGTLSMQQTAAVLTVVPGPSLDDGLPIQLAITYYGMYLRRTAVANDWEAWHTVVGF